MSAPDPNIMGASKFWPGRPTLITGANGLLGGWLTRHLAVCGADLVALVRKPPTEGAWGLGTVLDRTRIVTGDVRDQALLERVLNEYEIETVFHLAAQSIVPIANAEPAPTLETNVRGTWMVLEACRRSPQVRQIIVASSDKAYGQHEILPYHEELPLQGRHPYEVSKACADLLARSYARMFSLPVAVTRCVNFYGGGDTNWNRLVPGTIRSLLAGDAPEIRSDGQYVRDYLYIEDGVAAYRLLAERMAENPSLHGHAFNFSCETPVTVLEMVEKIVSMLDLNVLPLVRNNASHEIRRQYLSSAKAHQLLGWHPGFTLDEGLHRTIDWYRSHLGAEAGGAGD